MTRDVLGTGWSEEQASNQARRGRPSVARRSVFAGKGIAGKRCRRASTTPGLDEAVGARETAGIGGHREDHRVAGRVRRISGRRCRLVAQLRQAPAPCAARLRPRCRWLQGRCAPGQRRPLLPRQAHGWRPRAAPRSRCRRHRSGVMAHQAPVLASSSRAPCRSGRRGCGKRFLDWTSGRVPNPSDRGRL